jgi:methylmalonyl-CoA/ethylmalonyl-CoA epimerase
MVIDHIGLVVRSLEAGIQRWEELFGYRPATEPVVNTRQKVRVVFLEKEGSIPIKLIEPTDPSSPATGMAQKGGGLHHLCFRVDDLPAALERMSQQNARVLAAPAPGEAFENEDIAFVYAQHGLNVEVIATDKRARRLPKK